MRPDPRLLVPVSALPFVPEGARVWGGVAGSAWIAIGDRRRGMVLCDTEPDGSARDVRCFDRSPTMLLDASAPELRDGLPVRLDALPWLLKVLGWKSITLHADGSYDNGSAWFPPLPLDLTGLSHRDGERAVVAAAIMARGGGG